MTKVFDFCRVCERVWVWHEKTKKNNEKAATDDKWWVTTTTVLLLVGWLAQINKPDYSCQFISSHLIQTEMSRLESNRLSFFLLLISFNQWTQFQKQVDFLFTLSWFMPNTPHLIIFTCQPVSHILARTWLAPFFLSICTLIFSSVAAAVVVVVDVAFLLFFASSLRRMTRRFSLVERTNERGKLFSSLPAHSFTLINSFGPN